MSDEAGIAFDADRQATPWMVGRWKAKGANIGLNPDVELIDADGIATSHFRDLWRIGFPTRKYLPDVSLTTDGGGFSDDMLNIWL